jgi:glycosyltransferase involved in cell wall biosynthesis
MNVCIISRGDVFPPNHGAAAKIVNTAKYLSRLGDEVVLLTDDIKTYHVFSGGVRREEEYPAWLARVGFDAQAIRKRLCGMGVPPEDAFLYQPIFDRNFWARAVWAARRHRFRVIQAEFPGYVMPAYVAKNALVPRRPTVVLVEHNVEFLRIPQSSQVDRRGQRNLRRIEKVMIALCDRVVAVSPVDQASLVSAGVPRRKVAVIPHGVDLENYRSLEGTGVRERLGIPAGAFVIVYHGVLHYGPNRDAALWLSGEILPELLRRGRDVRLLLVGMNAPAECADGPAGGRVVATGAVPNLPAHLAAADAAVVPLRGGGGTRLKILEYFAAGLPVISTPKGAEGIPATPGREMALASTAGAIADAVCRLMDDHAHARALGEAGRRFVERYDWLEICRQYQELYRK